MARTINMKRNRLGQFVAKGRGRPIRRKKKRNPVHLTATKKRRSYKRRPTARKKRNPPTNWTAGVVSNRRKRNPPAISLDRQGRIMGVPVPAVSDVLYVGLGLAGPPIAKGTLVRFLPTTFVTNQGMMWATEAASYAAPVFVGYFVGGARGARNVLAGEAAGILVRLVSRWTGAAGLSNFPELQRGTPGVRGYLGPVASRSLRGYTTPTSPATLRRMPGRASTAIRTRSHSRYQ
jgi:hypothetical protein